MKNTLRKAEKVIKRNAPIILSTVGAVGVASTAVLAVKATPKALILLQQAKEEKNEELTLFEKAIVITPAYIPATLVGISTVACIFGAHVLNKKQQAALVSAYALLSTSYKEYKEKVKELHGEEGELAVRTAIANDKYEPQENENDGKNLFYDEFSQRFYRATNETVLRAEYEVNKEVSTNFYATINEYYSMIDLPPIDGGDEIGWASAQLYDMYWSDWVEFWHESAETEDGEKYYIIHMTEPLPDFSDY